LTGNLFPDGTFINRHFKANEFEWYVQDSWRARPNLTITFGLRHTILQTPYEENGQQIAPTIDTNSWYRQRNASALHGEVYEPLLQFSPNGPANHAPGLWSKQKTNFAPRLAIVYAPNEKTSIRSGFGLYFDHYGEGIVNTFDQFGSFGLNNSVTNPAGVYGIEDAPRFTGVHDVPNNGSAQPSAITYPYTYPNDAVSGFAIQWGVNNHLKTPYAEAMDFSIQRELKGGTTLEVAYVGRLGRHLLQALDMAEPVNYADPQGGGDYFTNAAKLSALVDANGGDNQASVPAIPYFEDVFPQLAGYDYLGESATQAIYTNEWAPYRYQLGETSSLADLDFYCSYTCPQGTKFWQSQFSSLYAWDSIGMSYYNAGQITLRHPLSHGLQADFSYTLSKSIDMGSDTERASEIDSNSAFSSIINTWNPSLNRGVSDFDTKQSINASGIWQLPFGKGHPYLSNAHPAVDAILGGWQISSIFRWNTGLPWSGPFDDGRWATNFEVQANGSPTRPVHACPTKPINGDPKLFCGDLNAVYQSFRNPYPGETGPRNTFRLPGYVDLDIGLGKTWTLHEGHTLQLRWDVFNVTNTQRLTYATDFSMVRDPALRNSTPPSDWTNFIQIQGQPRVMQVGARYAF